MARPFSERVVGADWRAGVEAWIGERLEAAGLRPVGPVEQPRVRPWSTQLTVPTDAGLLWFKATCGSMRFEASLHEVLATLDPHRVDAPFAVDAEQGWLITRDRGPTLGEQHDPTTSDWRRVVGEAGRLQQQVSSHRDRLLATGLPDCSPATVVARFDRLLELLGTLSEGHPAALDEGLVLRLRERRPALVDAVALLEASPIPSSWQHGDLHPRNVLPGDGDTVRMFDFGDSQWSHAIEVLNVPFGWVQSATSPGWESLLEVYRDVWNVDRAALDAAWRASALTHPVNRAMTWWACLTEASAAEWSRWGSEPSMHLERVLEQ